MQPAHLEGNEPLLAEVDRLLQRARLEVPEVDALAVPARAHVLQVEPRLVGVRLAELGRDEHVPARLVPEVVVERRVLAAVLPAALELERLRIDDGEAARAVAVRVAQHRHDDVVARHAVDGVRARVSGLPDHVRRLDHLLDRRPARIVGDVDDVEARRAKAGNDEVRPVGPVTGGRAPVPPEVVKLVADVRHRQLVDDPTLLGVDDGEKVRRFDPCALAQAGEVEELLLWRLHRLLRRPVERRRLVMLFVH